MFKVIFWICHSMEVSKLSLFRLVKNTVSRYGGENLGSQQQADVVLVSKQQNVVACTVM